VTYGKGYGGCAVLAARFVESMGEMMGYRFFANL
jgi:hypothetical protein